MGTNRRFLLAACGVAAIAAGCAEREEWLGLVYPDPSDLGRHKVIGAYGSLDACLRNVRSETTVGGTHPGGSYECGLNCRDEGVFVCERTVGNERAAPRAPVPAEHSEHAYVFDPDICSHGRVGAFGAHGVRGLCSMDGRTATCIHGGDDLLVSYAYTPAAADLLERGCEGGTFTRLR